MRKIVLGAFAVLAVAAICYLVFVYKIFWEAPHSPLPATGELAPWILNKDRDGADWPCWRGPSGDGISGDTKWNPQSLSESRIMWKLNVGKGFSSVAVQGQCLYTMGNKKDTDTVYCLRLDGRQVWAYSYPCKGGSYPGPRATPVIEGPSLYTLSREGHLFCLDAQTGEVTWNRHLGKELKAKSPRWGFASSPYIVGDLLAVNAGEHGMAFDKKTGKTLWASDPSGTPGYATPVKLGGESPKLAMFSGKAIYTVDLKSGKSLWSYSWETSWDVNAADPIIFKERLFITSGYGKGCALFDIKENPRLLWQNTSLASHFSSPVLIQGHLYGFDGQAGFAGSGQLRCVEWETGKVKWEQDIGFGALMAADGRLIILNEAGKLFIVQASSESYQEIASCEVLPRRQGSLCWTAPVLCRSMIFCRNDLGDLVCVDVSK